MHIKHIHETIEKLAQYACEEACKSKEAIDTEELSKVVEMVEKLACAEKDARISKAMEEADEEEKEEIKYIIKKMKEEGEDWGEEEARRFYRGQPRSKTSGRFMSRRDGRRNRGYEELMRYPMVPEMYDPMMDWDRDMDRGIGRLYYTNGGQSSGGNSGGQSRQSGGGSSSSMSSGNSSRGYEEGYSDGNRRGYEEGYSDGQRDGRKNNGGNESRYDKAKRGFEETKQMHKSNSPEDKTLTMKEAEKLANIVIDELIESIEDTSPEIKNMVKTKVMSKMQKV